MSEAVAEAPGAIDASSLKTARRERLRLLLRSGTFIAGFIIVGFWAVCAIFGHHIAPHAHSSA